MLPWRSTSCVGIGEEVLPPGVVERIVAVIVVGVVPVVVTADVVVVEGVGGQSGVQRWWWGRPAHPLLRVAVSATALCGSWQPET